MAAHWHHLMVKLMPVASIGLRLQSTVATRKNVLVRRIVVVRFLLLDACSGLLCSAVVQVLGREGIVEMLPDKLGLYTNFHMVCLRKLYFVHSRAAGRLR